MTLAYKNYLPLLIIVMIFLCIFCFKREQLFFDWIKTYWNFKRTRRSILSSLFLLSSFVLFAFSILDLRGPVEKIESNIKDQKTIILIDNSTSMLVRDVRPNRFSRSVTLARHFIRKSAGHQISVVLFSDTHKRLLPFTDDLDLLDSRLAGLQNLDVTRGGSNISKAMAEVIQYFKEDALGPDEISGNLLLLTDSEEHGVGPDFPIPESINVAVVGVGTQAGGRIPLRTRGGNLIGYKKYQGEEVVSRLVEDNIKAIGSNIENFRYWIALSYDLPTEEILSFFRNSFTENLTKKSMDISPVLMHYVVIVAIILYILSLIFFKMPALAPILMVLFVIDINSETDGHEQLLQRYKKGLADRRERALLAESFLEKKEYDKAKAIYKDVIEQGDNKSEYLFNYATSMLYSNEEEQGMELYSKLAEEHPDLVGKIQNNIMYFLKNSLSNQEDNNQQTGNDDSKQKEKQEREGQGQNQEGPEEENTGEDDGEQQENRDDNQSSGSEGQEENRDESEDAQGARNEEDISESMSVEERERKIKEKRQLTKTPALLKKLLQDDRRLQQKYLDTETHNRGSSRPQKDW